MANNDTTLPYRGAAPLPFKDCYLSYNLIVTLPRYRAPKPIEKSFVRSKIYLTVKHDDTLVKKFS
jgi:hypothetical protein